MIEYIEGDILDSPAQVIVNTVNTVGVMGKGLALEFKKRYPKMFDKYKIACEKHQFTIGKLMLFYEADHWLLLFPTKESWRNPSRLEYIESGLNKFVQKYAEKNITSIAFPRLGCGNGELKWSDVKPLMEKYLKDLPIDVYIYIGKNPDITPEHKEADKTIEWLKANAKDMSFNGVKDDLTYISAMCPYSFEVKNIKYKMTYSDAKLQISTIDDKENWTVDEDQLYQIWDDIREKSVFSEKEADEKSILVYGLLYATGYLSKIKLYDSKTEEMIDGYQINAALGRVIAFKG